MSPVFWVLGAKIKPVEKACLFLFKWWTFVKTVNYFSWVQLIWSTAGQATSQFKGKYVL